jgi:YegS/Rv2252/BmrU family lipid kinase
MSSGARPRWLAVLNPASGGGRALRSRNRIEALLREHGIDHALAVSEYAGHAVELAAQAARAGARHFLCIGGDGTLNEVVNGALAGGAGAGETTIALLPVGRGNDWARSFGIPRDHLAGVRSIAAGHTVVQDVGLAQFERGPQRYFVNVAGVGFDAHVVERTRALRLGPLTYLAGLLQGFMRYRAPRLKVSAAGFERDEEMFVAFAALGRYCGGGMHVAPGAVADDGCFDVVTIGRVSRLELLRDLRRLFDGTLPQHPKVRTARAERLHADAWPPTGVEADGEPIGVTPVTFVVVPRALRVVVPRK